MAYHFYCLCHRDETRKALMKASFDKAGLSKQYSFYDGVSMDDARITELTANHAENKAFSIMFGHLELIDAFYQDKNVDFGIFCENDISLRKDIVSLLPKVLEQYDRLNLDVLLLGYLLPIRLKDQLHLSYPRVGEVHGSYTFHSFPQDLWGAQMYVLSKEKAKIVLDKYGAGSGYAERSLQDTTMQPFASDWTITKDGKRAVLYPMLAVENDRVQHIADPLHANFHAKCFQAQFEEDAFF